VLVLLPPSEGKAPAPAGAPPADLAALAFPEALTAKRERLVAAVEKLANGRSEKRALAALGLSAGQAAELDRDRDLRGAPAAPAAEIYTGVLYQHLDLASLTPAARARADERLLVASALWGVVRLGDRIPAYRLSMGAKVPRLGGLAPYWRPALTAALPADALVVDLRSQTYASAWRPAEGTVVEVRAFVDDGRSRKVITHMAKATRGDVARILARARGVPRDPEGVAALVERAGHRVELGPGPRGDAAALDVILPPAAA